MMKFTTNNGYKVEEFKEGCIQITEPNKEQPSVLIVLSSLIEDYMDWTKKTNGMIDEAIEHALENDFDGELK